MPTISFEPIIINAKRAARQQQAAADGAFALRLLTACCTLAVTMWVLLPSCDEPARPARAAGPAPPHSVFGGMFHRSGDDGALVLNATGRIPRIIHQVVPPGGIADHLAPFQDSWQQQHPSWVYRLWRDNDTEALVRLLDSGRNPGSSEDRGPRRPLVG
jgi:hypothetical protein